MMITALRLADLDFPASQVQGAGTHWTTEENFERANSLPSVQ